jgi:hypothetical protein
MDIFLFMGIFPPFSLSALSALPGELGPPQPLPPQDFFMNEAALDEVEGEIDGLIDQRGPVFPLKSPENGGV